MLHASAKPIPATDDDFPRGIRCPDLKTLTYSAICGVARVLDITPKSRSKWFDGPGRGKTNYAWVLADATPLRKPIRCKGALQLWTVPPNIVRAIKRQLPKIDFSEA